MNQRVYMVSQQLIANNIDLISAKCWEGYQQEGRGIVLIDGGLHQDLPPAGSPLVYLSTEEAQKPEHGWPMGNLKELIDKYKPDSEILVGIKWRGEVGLYRLKPPIAPPAAYEKLNKSGPAIN